MEGSAMTISVHLEAEARTAASFGVSAASSQWTYTFNPFFHPFVGDLIAQLNQSSVAGMLDPAFLAALKHGYGADYDVLATSAPNLESIKVRLPSATGLPPITLDLSSSGPYAGYNWELLYHIPVTIAVHLSQSQ